MISLDGFEGTKYRWNKTLLAAVSKTPVGRDTQWPLIVALQKVQSPSASDYPWVHQEPPAMPDNVDKMPEWVELLRQVTA